MDFGIIDCHAHIFPPLAGACGFADAATHLLHQQRAMHEHGNQPYRRARDDAIVTERALWSADDPSVAGRREVELPRRSLRPLRMGGRMARRSTCSSCRRTWPTCRRRPR